MWKLTRGGWGERRMPPPSSPDPRSSYLIFAHACDVAKEEGKLGHVVQILLSLRAFAWLNNRQPGTREGSVRSLANERNIHSWETILCIYGHLHSHHIFLFSQASWLGCKFACTTWHKRIGAKNREVCFLGQQKRTKAGGKNRKRTNLKGSGLRFFSSFSISLT